MAAGVFDRTRSAVATLEEVAADLEPGCLDLASAKGLVDLSTRYERLSGAARGVEDAVAWKLDRHRTHHHRLKTFCGWQVVGPPDARQLLPPDNPDPP